MANGKWEDLAIYFEKKYSVNNNEIKLILKKCRSVNDDTDGNLSFGDPKLFLILSKEYARKEHYIIFKYDEFSDEITVLLRLFFDFVMFNSMKFYKHLFLKNEVTNKTRKRTRINNQKELCNRYTCNE